LKLTTKLIAAVASKISISIINLPIPLNFYVVFRLPTSKKLYQEQLTYTAALTSYSSVMRKFVEEIKRYIIVNGTMFNLVGTFAHTQ